MHYRLKEEMQRVVLTAQLSITKCNTCLRVRGVGLSQRPIINSQVFQESPNKEKRNTKRGKKEEKIIVGNEVISLKNWV